MYLLLSGENYHQTILLISAQSNLVEISQLTLSLKLILVFLEVFESLEKFTLIVESFQNRSIPIWVKYQFKFVVMKGILRNRIFEVVAEVVRRWKNGVQANPQHILYHMRNEPLENRRWQFQARVCIDLNQPRFKIVINHII